MVTFDAGVNVGLGLAQGTLELALALFVAARVGLLPSLGITAAAMLVSDFIQFADKGYDTWYLPFAPTYLGLAIYAAIPEVRGASARFTSRKRSTSIPL